MTKDQLYQQYLQSSRGREPLGQEDMFANPALNFDIYEDSSTVVNRLFYVLPLPDSQSLFVFFEDNRFLKGPGGDLSPAGSSLHLWQPER